MLSSLKTEFKERLGLDLIETRLGYEKLSEVFADSVLADAKVAIMAWRAGQPVVIPHDNLIVNGPSRPLLPVSSRFSHPPGACKYSNLVGRKNRTRSQPYAPHGHHLLDSSLRFATILADSLVSSFGFTDVEVITPSELGAGVPPAPGPPFGLEAAAARTFGEFTSN